MLTRTRQSAGFVVAAAFAVAVAGDAAAQAEGSLPADFSPLAEPLLPAVVAISTERALPRPERPENGIAPPDDDPSAIEEFFRRFFGRTAFSPLQQPGLPGEEPPGAMPQPEGPMPDEGPMPEGGLVPFGAGSGFFTSADGLVVTNNHVVAEATAITVTLHDGREFDAELIGRDEMTEIAVLRIDADEELTALSWGDSDAVQVGEWVLAVGNPFGIGNSVTAGIISARPRAIGLPIPIDVLQTDAALNVGNSGGPLVNRQGEVVGVNVAILSPVGADIGIGFSIPSNVARGVVDTIAAEGEVRRGWLGVATQSLDERLAGLFGIEETEGALVSDVIEQSPADAAGLRPGDVILAVDGERVDEPGELMLAIAESEIGSTVALDVVRVGEVVQVQAEIGEREEEALARPGPGPEEEMLPPDPGIGMELAPVPDDIRQALGVEDGALVAEIAPGGRAMMAGLRPGDVILNVGGEPVRSPAEAVERMEELRREGEEDALIYVARGELNRFVALPLDAL